VEYDSNAVYLYIEGIQKGIKTGKLFPENLQELIISDTIGTIPAVSACRIDQEGTFEWTPVSGKQTVRYP